MSNRLESLAWAALTADVNLKEAKKQADDAKKLFVEALKAADKLHPDTKAIGNVRTKIQNNRKFDVESAIELVDALTLKNSMEMTVNATKLKNGMSPEQIEKSMVFYDNPYKLTLEVLRD